MLVWILLKTTHQVVSLIYSLIFWDVNNIDLLVPWLDQKIKTLSLNGGDLMVIPSHGWNHEVDGSIGRLSPTQRKPTLQRSVTVKSDTTINQRHNSAIPKAWERQNCCCLASLKHLETWMFFFGCLFSRRGVDDDFPKLKISKTESHLFLFTCWCHVEVWCWT